MNFMTDIMHSSLLYQAELIFRLLLALVLGGLVGFERENLHRPAGFRTHILVCVGAALVMITSEFLFNKYSGLTNADPARLGAQVISGIGFLGAGTIMKEGVTVKGLTTAASLWAVSCVGIAVGIGFYVAAIAATVIIYITLISLKRMQITITEKKFKKMFCVYVDYIPGKINEVKEVYKRYGLTVQDVEFINDDNGQNTIAKFNVEIPQHVDKQVIVDEILSLQGVRKVYEC